MRTVARKDRTEGLYSSKVSLTLPPSPRGVASLMDLNTEPDFRAADDVLVVGWETDPAVTREYVPEPLEVDDSGVMYLMTVTRCGYVGRTRAEFISPERLTQRESFLKIPCSYRGQQYVFRSFSWGDRDRLVTAGRQVGLFHKFGRIQMTQFHPFHPTWNGPHEGARICVSVENIGTVLRAYGDLRRPVGPDEELPSGVAPAETVPNVGLRYVFDSCRGRPALNDLVVDQVTSTRETRDMWTGEGWIHFYEAENEEVQQFEPRRMLGAWWWRMRRRRGIGRAGGRPRVIHEFGDAHPYASRPLIRALLEAEA